MDRYTREGAEERQVVIPHTVQWGRTCEKQDQRLRARVRVWVSRAFTPTRTRRSLPIIMPSHLLTRSHTVQSAGSARIIALNGAGVAVAWELRRGGKGAAASVSVSYELRAASRDAPATQQDLSNRVPR